MESTCRHRDIRDFDGIRTCLACGDVVFDDHSSLAPDDTTSPRDMLATCTHSDIRKFNGIRTCLACGEAVFDNSHLSATPTEAQSDTYQYNKLNYILGQEIRLLIVEPGEPDDPIHCDIVTFNLEDDPAYEAVSYTWATESGDSSLTETIHVGKSTLCITRNCHAAIHRLRKSYMKRRLWVDAVCINQDYIHERNHQVRLMEQIYSKAVRVLVYLDSHTYHFKSLFEWLEDRTEVEATPDQEDDAVRLLRLRWFRRVWVIQEVALAKNVRLFVKDAEVGLSAHVLEKLRNLWGRHPNINPWPSPLRWTPESRETRSVSSLLRATRDSLATDERDKVYAILSLIEDKYRRHIPVDYSMSQEWVFAKLTMAIVIEDRTLDVLCLLDVHRLGKQDEAKHTSVEDWPSWIPSYSGTPSAKIVQFGKHNTGPWQPFLSTNHLRISDPESRSPKRPRLSSIEPSIEVTESLGRSLKPVLRIRAHYLDDIKQSVWVRGIGAHDYAENYWQGLSTSGFYKDIFSSVDSISNTRTASYPIPENTITPFLEAARATSPKGTHQVFRTSHSLGFATFDYEHNVRLLHPDVPCEGEYYMRNDAGDGQESETEFTAEIFALDGARCPFILRKRGVDQYTIVTACYLMGALQYDDLSKEGARGPWGAYPALPAMLERSRMIEIV